MSPQNVNLKIPLSFKQVVEIARQLSPSEKQQLTEILWTEQNIDESHQKLVMERFDKVRTNPERLLNWTEAKKTLKF